MTRKSKYSLPLNHPIEAGWIKPIEVTARRLTRGGSPGYVKITIKNHPIVGSVGIFRTQACDD